MHVLLRIKTPRRTFYRWLCYSVPTLMIVLIMGFLAIKSTVIIGPFICLPFIFLFVGFIVAVYPRALVITEENLLFKQNITSGLWGWLREYINDEGFYDYNWHRIPTRLGLFLRFDFGRYKISLNNIAYYRWVYFPKSVCFKNLFGIQFFERFSGDKLILWIYLHEGNIDLDVRTKLDAILAVRGIKQIRNIKEIKEQIKNREHLSKFELSAETYESQQKTIY